MYYSLALSSDSLIVTQKLDMKKLYNVGCHICDQAIKKQWEEKFLREKCFAYYKPMCLKAQPLLTYLLFSCELLWALDPW